MRDYEASCARACAERFVTSTDENLHLTFAMASSHWPRAGAMLLWYHKQKPTKYRFRGSIIYDVAHHMRVGTDTALDLLEASGFYPSREKVARRKRLARARRKRLTSRGWA